jgi:large subunit ribosomal protein L5
MSEKELKEKKETKAEKEVPKAEKEVVKDKKEATKDKKEGAKDKKEGDKGKKEAAKKEISLLKMRLKEKFNKEIVPKLKEKFSYGNIMQVPRLEKVIVSMGVGEALINAKAMDSAVGDLVAITGQRPVVTSARKSVAAFKLRKGMKVGCKVTLRGKMMYAFLDKLFNVVLPRVRDFRGLSPKSFDGRGNYAIGIKEQIIFPEIDYDKVDKVRGMNVVIVTTAKTDEECLHLLKSMGCPIRTG